MIFIINQNSDCALSPQLFNSETNLGSEDLRILELEGAFYVILSYLFT